MWFEDVIFFIAAIGALAGALGVVLLQNPFYSVLSLVCHLLGLAVLFLLLNAEFLAAAQVVIYAGAVMVLYIFVVAYIGGAGQPPGVTGAARRVPRPRLAGAGRAVAADEVPPSLRGRLLSAAGRGGRRGGAGAAPARAGGSGAAASRPPPRRHRDHGRGRRPAGGL